MLGCNNVQFEDVVIVVSLHVLSFYIRKKLVRDMTGSEGKAVEIFCSCVLCDFPVVFRRVIVLRSAQRSAQLRWSRLSRFQNHFY